MSDVLVFAPPKPGKAPGLTAVKGWTGPCSREVLLQDRVDAQFLVCCHPREGSQSSLVTAPWELPWVMDEAGGHSLRVLEAVGHRKSRNSKLLVCEQHKPPPCTRLQTLLLRKDHGSFSAPSQALTAVSRVVRASLGHVQPQRGCFWACIFWKSVVGILLVATSPSRGASPPRGLPTPPCHDGEARSDFCPGPRAGAAELFGADQGHLRFALTRASTPL